MFLMATAFHGVSVWNVRGSRCALVLGGLAFALAVLVKLTPGLLVLPLFWLLYTRGRRRTVLGLPGIWIAMCVAAPVLIWYTDLLVERAGKR